MSGFGICEGSQYNKKRLVLEQAALIFEMELFKIYFTFLNKI